MGLMVLLTHVKPFEWCGIITINRRKVPRLATNSIIKAAPHYAIKLLCMPELHLPCMIQQILITQDNGKCALGIEHRLSGFGGVTFW